MKKYGFKGIIFIIADKIKKNTPKLYMDKDQISELIKQGWELGSHSTTHPKLNNIPPEDIEEEIKGSKALLERAFGKPVAAFAYPYGIFNSRILNLARDHYRYGYTTIKGNNHGLGDFYLIERYLILETTQISNFARNLRARRLDCRIETDIYNEVLYINVWLPEEFKGHPFEAYFNSGKIKNFTVGDGAVKFKFSHFYEYNNFSIFLNDDKGHPYNITRMIHINKSADLY